MNTQQIRQLFIELAKSLPDRDDFQPRFEGATRPIMLTDRMLIRENMVLFAEAADQYVVALEKIDALTKKTGAWSRESVDRVLSTCLAPVAAAPLQEREDIIRVQAEEIRRLFGETPDTWQVDISVFGMSSDCSGLTFGKLRFMTGPLGNNLKLPSPLDDFDDSLLFARASVTAIDKKSAVAQARSVVDTHLAVLNALCSQDSPSITRLFSGTELRQVQSVTRCYKEGESDDSDLFSLEGRNKAVLLNRGDCDAFLRRRGGERISALFISPSAFGMRLISAYVTAGTACIEDQLHLAFLLYAIALESVVLGKDKDSEIGIQLSTRVAHLLGKDLAARRQISSMVKRLYGIRSKIVHAGETNIIEKELLEMRAICMPVLLALTTFSEFSSYTSTEELEEWFKDRLLGATPE